MYLLLSEKTALLSLLLEIMNADAIVSDQEIAYLNSVLSKYGLSQSDVIKAKQADVRQSISVVRNMDNEKKKEFYHIFQAMGRANGEPFPQTTDAVNQITIQARLLDAVFNPTLL